MTSICSCSSLSQFFLFFSLHTACASSAGIAEKKFCRPVWCSGFEDLNRDGGGGGGGGRSESEVIPELTLLDLPEDGGISTEIPEPDWVVSS